MRKYAVPYSLAGRWRAQNRPCDGDDSYVFFIENDRFRGYLLAAQVFLNQDSALPIDRSFYLRPINQLIRGADFTAVACLCCSCARPTGLSNQDGIP